MEHNGQGVQKEQEEPDYLPVIITALLELNSNKCEVSERARQILLIQIAFGKWNGIALLVDYYVEFKSEKVLDLFKSVQPPHEQEILNRIDAFVRRKHQNAPAALLLLGKIAQKAPFWAPLIICHPVFKLILSYIQDTAAKQSPEACVTGILLVCHLLPYSTGVSILTLNLIFNSFLSACEFLKRQYREIGERDEVERHFVDREQEAINVGHLSLAIREFFHSLYGIYPQNFLYFLKQFFGRDPPPGRTLLLNIVLNPLLASVRFHPNLLVMTRDREISRSRWTNREPHDFLHEASNVVIGVLPPPLCHYKLMDDIDDDGDPELAFKAMIDLSDDPECSGTSNKSTEQVTQHKTLKERSSENKLQPSTSRDHTSEFNADEYNITAFKRSNGSALGTTTINKSSHEEPDRNEKKKLQEVFKWDPFAHPEHESVHSLAKLVYKDIMKQEHEHALEVAKNINNIKVESSDEITTECTLESDEEPPENVFPADDALDSRVFAAALQDEPVAAFLDMEPMISSDDSLLDSPSRPDTPGQPVPVASKDDIIQQFRTEYGIFLYPTASDLKQPARTVENTLVSEEPLPPLDNKKLRFDADAIAQSKARPSATREKINLQFASRRRTVVPLPDGDDYRFRNDPESLKKAAKAAREEIRMNGRLLRKPGSSDTFFYTDKYFSKLGWVKAKKQARKEKRNVHGRPLAEPNVYDLNAEKDAESDEKSDNLENENESAEYAGQKANIINDDCFKEENQKTSRDALSKLIRRMRLEQFSWEKPPKTLERIRTRLEVLASAKARRSSCPDLGRRSAATEVEPKFTLPFFRKPKESAVDKYPYLGLLNQNTDDVYIAFGKRLEQHSERKRAEYMESGKTFNGILNTFGLTDPVPRRMFDDLSKTCRGLSLVKQRDLLRSRLNMVNHYLLYEQSLRMLHSNRNKRLFARLKQQYADDSEIAKLKVNLQTANNERFELREMLENLQNELNNKEDHFEKHLEHADETLRNTVERVVTAEENATDLMNLRLSERKHMRELGKCTRMARIISNQKQLMELMEKQIHEYEKFIPGYNRMLKENQELNKMVSYMEHRARQAETPNPDDFAHMRVELFAAKRELTRTQNELHKSRNFSEVQSSLLEDAKQELRSEKKRFALLDKKYKKAMKILEKQCANCEEQLKDRNSKIEYYQDLIPGLLAKIEGIPSHKKVWRGTIDPEINQLYAHKSDSDENDVEQQADWRNIFRYRQTHKRNFVTGNVRAKLIDLDPTMDENDECDEIKKQDFIKREKENALLKQCGFSVCPLNVLHELKRARSLPRLGRRYPDVAMIPAEEAHLAYFKTKRPHRSVSRDSYFAYWEDYAQGVLSPNESIREQLCNDDLKYVIEVLKPLKNSKLYNASLASSKTENPVTKNKDKPLPQHVQAAARAALQRFVRPRHIRPMTESLKDATVFNTRQSISSKDARNDSERETLDSEEDHPLQKLRELHEIPVTQTQPEQVSSKSQLRPEKHSTVKHARSEQKHNLYFGSRSDKFPP